MESLTWPGLLAECGLTSGSDKGPSEAELTRRLEEKRRKTTLPPTPINFKYSGQRMQGKQNSWMWASFRLSEPGGEGRPACPAAGQHRYSLTELLLGVYLHKREENGTFRTRARGGAEAHLAQVRPLQGKGQVESSGLRSCRPNGAHLHGGARGQSHKPGVWLSGLLAVTPLREGCGRQGMWV